jgi:hypothetical protein
MGFLLTTKKVNDIEPPNPNDPSNYPDITAGGRFPIPAVETTGSTQAPGPSREASEAVLRGIPSDLLDILRQTTSEERRKFEADLNLQLYKEKLALSEAAALAKSREKSQRELELENIRSWKEIEKAQIMRDTVMATQLAQTAYIAGTPNANVLSAIGPSQRQVMAAFQPGTLTFYQRLDLRSGKSWLHSSLENLYSQEGGDLCLLLES